MSGDLDTRERDGTERPRPFRRRNTPSLRAARQRRKRSLREDAFNIPNLLTMARILAIPVVIWRLARATPKDCFWAAVIFAAAAITDFFDGYLARKQGLVSVLGKFLDPLADKLIVMATLVYLVPLGRIPAGVVVLLLAREMAITGLRSIAATEGMVIAAGDSGKQKTALQMVGILFLLVGFSTHLTLGPWDLGIVKLVPVGQFLIYFSLVFSLLSAAEYIHLFATAVESKAKRQKP